MPTLEEQIKYCQDARDILGTPGYFFGKSSTEESKAATKALDAVARKITAFRERGSLDYKNCALEFYDLAELGKISAASNDRSLALTLTARLVHLGNRLDAAAGKAVDLNGSRSRLTTAVEKIYQDAIDAATAKKIELTGKNTQQPAHTLYGGPFTFDGGVENLTNEAQRTAVTPNLATQTANLPDRANEVTEAIKILAGVKKAHSEGLKLHTDYEAYKAKMDQAEKYRVELFLLSTFEVDYSKTFTDEMEAARNAAAGTPQDFQAAVTRLNGVIPTYNTLKKEADAAKGKKELAAEKKPIYDDKVRRIENDIRDLKALPGTKDAVTQLEGKLEASRDVVKNSGDYELARQSLKGSNKAHEAGKTAADNFKKTMDPGYKTELEKANAVFEVCEKLVGRSQSQTIAGFRKEIDANVFGFSNDPSTLATAKDGLIRIYTRLVDLKGDEEEKLKECITERTDASGKIEEFQKRYLIANYDVLPKFRQAESEFAVDNYAEAKTLYEGVIKDLTSIEGREENKPAYDAWMKSKYELEARDGPRVLEEALETFSESVKELKYDALARETTAMLKNWQLSRDYKAANAIALRAIAAVVEIGPKLNTFNKQEKDRVTLRGLTKKCIDSVTQSISKLEKKLGDVEPYKNLLDTYKAEWTTIRETKTFEAVENFNAAFEAFETKVNDEIVNPIDAMLKAFDKNEIYLANKSDPDNELTATENKELEKLTDSIKAASNKKTAKETAKKFEQKLSEISATITFMKKDASAYASLVPAVDVDSESAKLVEIKKDLAAELEKDTAQNFDTLNNEVTALETDLASVIAALDTKRGSQRTAAITRIKACSDSLEQLKHSNPKFETYFKEFTNRVEDLRSMADSKILTTVDQCYVAADALEKTLDELSNSKSFSNINDDLKDIEKGFEDLAKINTLPERLKGIKMRFEKIIEPDLDKKGPVKGKSDVVAFLTEVKAAVEDATAAKTSKDAITGLVKDCTDELLKMTDAPNLKASLVEMITSASTPAEGGEESARQRLEIIKMKIERLNSAPAELLKEEQSKAREKNKEDLEEIQFEAEREVFTKKRFPEAKVLMESTKPNENSDLYGKISELTNEADKEFKARNFAMALKKLEAARTAAQRFLNNPFSIKVNAKNNLKKVGEDWLKTISTFVKSMNELKAVVEASMTAENEGKDPQKFNADSFTAMKEPLTEAARSFEATKFRDFIDKISKADDPAKIREYRRLKEDALRFVRAYQTIVTKDPVLLSAASNPFNVEVSLSSVKDALRVLEINLRRA